MKKILSVILIAVIMCSIIGLSNAGYAYEVADEDILAIEIFDQPEDSLGMWFSWLPMDISNKKTYHNMLAENFGRTFHELILPFDTGRIEGEELQNIQETYGLWNGVVIAYYLDEIQQTFNATYNTDIDMSSLDGLTLDGSFEMVRVIDNYFIVMSSPHGTVSNPNPISGSRLGENSEYWRWCYQDEWNLNDTIYTIITYKNVAGYDIRVIDYIGYEPPSDEFFSLYNNTSDSIKVVLNGNNIEFDQPPVIIDGRTLVPVRAICEAMGFEVMWDQENAVAKITNGRTTLHIPLNSYSVYMGNDLEVEHIIDVPAQIINDRTLIPARVMAEAFGAEVSWDGETRIVIINYTVPEELYFVEGAPPQYGATHALVPDVAIKLIKERYGIDAELVMTGNTLQWYEGGGYTFTVYRWYTIRNNESVYQAEIDVAKGDSGFDVE